jgi:acetyl esterase/lipase
VAVVVHGGAWVAGSKNLVANIGYALAESGVAAVCVNYRLSPFVDHPAHVQDVSRAVAWTRANLGEYGADTSRIFLIGHSAGGHLVSLAGTKSVYLGDQGIDNADLSGVIAISGVYAIDNDVFELIFGDDPDEWAKASPINYASADDPPFMVLYAQNDMDDEVDLAAQAEEFYAELRAQGVEASLYEIPGANHNSIIGQIGKGGSASEQLILDFIDSHSKVTRTRTALCYSPYRRTTSCISRGVSFGSACSSFY